jgi:hypothetical protein
MSTYNSPSRTATYDLPARSERPEYEIDAAQDLIQYLREYAREKPEVAALWCFGIGFVLGWKLKPW